MLLHRDQMESIRRTGYIASPENVIHRVAVKGKTTRASGGDPCAVTRMFLRGIVQGKIPLNKQMGTHQAMADKLNNIWEANKLSKTYPKLWKSHDLQNTKKAKFEPGSIKANILLEDIVESLAESFGADPAESKKIIFNFEDFKKNQEELIGEAISAIIDGPRKGISPFKELSAAGYLPDLQRIKDAFKEQLSEEQLKIYMKKTFIPGGRPSYDKGNLKRIFYSLGIPSSKAEQCAKRVVSTPEFAKKIRRNPGQKKCVEHFLLYMTAYIQTDMNFKVKNSQKKLQKFGLSRNRYYAIKNERFSSNSIKNTLENKAQIKKMARVFKIDPSESIDKLIER